MTYLHALLLTQLVEAPVYAALLAALLTVPVANGLSCSLTVNLVSHPLFVFVLVPAAAAATSSMAGVLIGELVVWGLESALIRLWWGRDLPTIAAIALLANSASFLAGLLLLR